jgi:hypothetical protein
MPGPVTGVREAEVIFLDPPVPLSGHRHAGCLYVNGLTVVVRDVSTRDVRASVVAEARGQVFVPSTVSGNGDWMMGPFWCAWVPEVDVAALQLRDATMLVGRTRTRWGV